MHAAAREIRPDRVAIYIRWSTEDQGEGTTLQVQLEACRTYALSQGWAVSEELTFIDDGVSGGSLERPALARLRQEVQAGRVDCVVVYKVDRLSRSVVDMVRLVLDEWEGLCYLKSAREPIDTQSQTGKMFFYQLMSFAEWERSTIRERMFSGKLRRAQEGRNPGMTAAYGYRIGTGGEFKVEPAEAEVVRLIFRLYVSGLGVRAVAGRLNELGHPSPAGRRWDPSTVARMLENPIYTGTLVYGRETEFRGHRVRRPEPFVVREGVAPAIVEEAAFRAAQQVKAARPGVGRRGRSGRSVSSRSLLTGLLACRCGRSYFGTAPRGEGGRYAYYACTASHGKGTSVCQGGRIRQDLLDRVVVQAVLERFGGEGARGLLLIRVTEELAAGAREARGAVESAAAELAKVGAKEDRLKALFLEGEISVAEFRELKGTLHREQARLKAGLAAARERLARAERAVQDRQELAERLAHVDRWEALEPHERKQLLRHFITRVVAYRLGTGNVECAIDWRWGSEGADPTVQVVNQPRSSGAMRKAALARHRDAGGRFSATAGPVTGNPDRPGPQEQPEPHPNQRQRMLIDQREYGLTELRLYTAAGIGPGASWSGTGRI